MTLQRAHAAFLCRARIVRSMKDLGRTICQSVPMQLLLVACLFAGTLWAADDPFVGKWKFNPSKSKLTEEMKVESAGGNKYAFDFGGGIPETIVTDGTDQPGYRGTTLSVSVLGQDSWKVVRKKDGRLLLRGAGSFPKTATRAQTTTQNSRRTGPAPT